MHLAKPIRYLVPMLLLCLCANYVQGQSALIEQEQHKLPFIKDSISLVGSLNRIGMLYHLKNPDSCFYYGMKAKGIAIRLHYRKGKTSADNVIASALYLKGLPRESLELFSKVLFAYKQLQDTANVALVLMNMSTVYKNLADSIQARNLCYQAIQTGSRLKKDSIMSMIYANYCLINSAPDDSIRYYLNKSAEIAKRYKDERMLVVTQQIAAENLLKAGHRQQALPLIIQSLAASRNTGMEFLEINSLGLYADYYTGKPDSILHYYNLAYQLAQQKGYVYLKVTVLKIILAYTELSGNKDKIISAHHLLESALVAENNNQKKFIGDYIKYNAIQDDNTLLEISNKINKTKIGLLVAVCTVSILLILIIYRLYQVSRRHEHQQEKLNLQIKQQNSTLQEADEFKNKLISILAHDFRTPLISTISIARMMRDNQGFTEAEMERFYADIEKDAAQILGSFDVILQWIRQQLSGYQFNAETLMLHELFIENENIFRQLLESKNITCANRVPSDMMVISDKEMLQFVNRNLLSNAIRFSPQGGTIIISATQGVNDFTITVSDEGPGMTTGTIDQLFSVSEQFGSSTQHGAGIALSMCRDFIGKLGGRIWAENKEPHGAIFYYTIPLTHIK